MSAEDTSGEDRRQSRNEGARWSKPDPFGLTGAYTRLPYAILACAG